MDSPFAGSRERGVLKNGPALYLGLLPVLLLIVLLVGFRLFLRSSAIYEPSLLLPVLNTVFLFLVSCVVAYVAGRSYLRSGSPTVILLGCGVLTLGIGALAAGWLIGPEGPNVNVTIFNVAALLSSVFHAMGAVVDLSQRPPEPDPARRGRNMLAGYLGAAVFVALLALAASTGALPRFFVQGMGPTPLRQTVLAVALVLFAGAASYMMSRFITKKREFFYWYSLALFLLSMMVIGALLEPAVGSLLGWVARCCQYLAGIYFFLSVGSASRDARILGVSVDEAMAEVFRQSERRISAILSSIPDGHYELDRNWRFIRINDYALAYFGRSKREFLGQSFWDVFPVTKGSVFEERYRKVVSGGTSAHFEEQSAVLPDRWIEFHIYAMEEGGLSVFFRDITDGKRARVALQESEQRWATTLASIGDGVIATDTSGRITFMNGVAEELTGWTSAEAVMKPVAEVFHIVGEQTREVVEDPVAKVLQGGMIVGLANHTLLVRKDGTEVPIDDSGAPIKDADGNTRGVVLVFRDIGERKKAEEQLEQSNKRVNEILNSIQDDFYVLDRNWKFVYASKSFTSRIGKEPKDFVGNNIWEMFPKHVGTDLEENFRAAMDGKKIRRFEVGGKYTDRSYAMTAFPSPDGITVLGTDITERKQAGEALRQSEAKFRSVLENSRDVIYRLNLQTGRYEYIGPSAETVTGFSSDELAAQGVEAAQAMIHPDDLPMMKLALTRLEKTGQAEAEYRQRTKDGDYRWMSNRMSLTRDGAGLPLHRDGNIRDVTESKQAEKALKESERRFRSLYENNLDGVMITCIDGSVLAANEKMCDLVGMTEAEIMGAARGGIAVYDSDTEAALEERKRTGHFRGELRYRRKDGSHVPVEISSCLFEDSDGRILTGTVVRDITGQKAAEEALRMSERRERERAQELATMMEAVPTPVIIVHDPNATHMTGNRAADELLRQPHGAEVSLSAPSDVKPRHFRAIKDGRELMLDELPAQRAARGEHVGDFEFSLVFDDGTTRHLLAYGTPLWDDKGQPRGAVHTLVDITERKEMEEALQTTFRRFYTVLSSMYGGLLLVTDKGRVEFANQALCDYFDLEDSPEDIGGLTTPEVFGKIGEAYLNPDEALARVREIVDRGEPVRGEQVAMRGGRELLRDFIPIRIGGQSYGRLWCHTDITERKEMERALQKARDDLEQRVIERTEQLVKSEREFRLLAEAMPQIVWITDADGRNIYFNQQWVDYTGLTLEESYGHGWNRPFHPDDQKRAWDAWQNAVTNNGTYSLECRLRKADGTYRWWLIRGVPVVNERGEVTKWFGTCTDIEELKGVEAQLRQAQKMEALGTMSGGIAHDFNNILAAIIGFSELLVDHSPEGSRDARHLHRILEAGIRGRELVRQMLTFSRKAEQEKKPLAVGSIVKETVKLLRATTPSTISIRINVSSEALILADPTQIQQVLMNLCTNAAYAMREKGGSLDIELSDYDVSPSNGDRDGIEPGSYVRLTVRDTGIGISPDIMDKIFDPFFTTKKLGEGTGLGLSVVHGIVKQHDGAITVASEPGKGSTFTLYFPQIMGGLGADADHDDDIPTGTERILFVDDEEALVEMGEDILAELGYDVVSRTRSGDALALLKEDPDRFDLVLTDQTMPGMTGLELAGEILTIRADMPIIMCTGFSHTANEESAKAAGIRAFAMKPLTKREIAKTIRKVLEG